MKKKRLILPLCCLLLAAAAAFGVYWTQGPEELRREVLFYVEAQSGLASGDWVTDEETGRVLERYMGGGDMERLDLAEYISNAKSLRRVFSVPELEPPVLHAGGHISGSGGTLYYSPPHSMGAIEISLADGDGDWLDLYAAGNCAGYPQIAEVFKEKMKQRVLENFRPGDSDECSVPERAVEIRTQEGLALLLRCIDNCNYLEDITGLLICECPPPHIYIGSAWISYGGTSCVYRQPDTDRAVSFGFTESDGGEMYRYLEAALDGQEPLTIS